MNQFRTTKKVLVLSFFICFRMTIVCADNNPDIPRGRTEEFIFDQSHIYPGTSREVVVYIPSQIDPQIPACVYVQQDGIRPNSVQVMDSLIAAKLIPVTVGVFIRPGLILPPDTNTVFRQNRCFEYNSLGDRYARFILEEILPHVADKYHLNLSEQGNDRAIGGGSSGGIAAFNAAWERPDAFTRVYCISGSFVAFRGGQEFPSLVRKTEAKPIRSYMTTATRDMENCAGDWTLLDMEMDKALKFSGYDYRFKVIDGKHGAGFRECFAEAMTYLWQGWPEPVKTGQSAPRVRDIILPGEAWTPVAGVFTDLRGPACNSKGEVFFADAAENRIYKIGLETGVGVFLEKAGYPNSLSVGPRDEIYTASVRTQKIMRYMPDGKHSVYTRGIAGEYVLARPDGGLYVACAPSDSGKGAIYLVKGNAKKVLDADFRFPSGMAMSPDRWLLAVADKYTHHIYSYTLAPDGQLQNKEPYFWLHVPDRAEYSETGSVCYDREGHLYAATVYGIQVCAWDGPNQVILPLPGHEKVTGVCIGGKDMDILYAFCGNKIYQRKIRNHAVGAFSPWTPMTRGKL